MSEVREERLYDKGFRPGLSDQTKDEWAQSQARIRAHAAKERERLVAEGYFDAPFIPKELLEK